MSIRLVPFSVYIYIYIYTFKVLKFVRARVYYNLHIFQQSHCRGAAPKQMEIYLIRHLQNPAKQNPHKYTLVINVNHINDTCLMYGTQNGKNMRTFFTIILKHQQNIMK